MEEVFLPRQRRLQARLTELSLDGVLVTTLENVRYLCGFSGSSGVIILGSEGGHFLTDSRYSTQAEEEVAGLEINVYKDQLEGIKASINKLGLVKLGFEPEGISYGQYSSLCSSLPKLELVPLKEELGQLRIIKEKTEVEYIKQAITIAASAFEQIRGQVRPGVRERDIALEMEYLMRKQGGGPISFELIVASGWRGALPHGIASEKKIAPGELVILDFGASFKGYFSDETQTALVPPVSDRHRSVYNVVKEAHDLAVAAVRPGALFTDIDQQARGHIERAGYGRYFGHGLGHGLGLAVHEPPAIAPNREGEAKEGMVFTIEPGIYIPGWGGVRLEDVVLVTGDGCTVLTETPKELWLL